EVAVLGAAGREAEAALPDGERRHAVPARERAVRVPVELGVVVGVEIDGAGRDDAAARVELALAAPRDRPADAGDPPLRDRDIGTFRPARKSAKVKFRMLQRSPYMRASRRCTSWKLQIGCPNCSRSFEYLSASSNARSASPRERVGMPARSSERRPFTWSRSLTPPPRRFARGMRTSSR